MISFAGDSVTAAVVVLLIDRRDQLALIELMILSGVRMLLAFLLFSHRVNRGGEKKDGVAGEEKEERAAGKRKPRNRYPKKTVTILILYPLSSYLFLPLST